MLLIAPHFFYPLFLAKILCFALFACAFNLLLGSCGLLSFGHAAYYGTAAYVAAHAAKEWGLPFEVSHHPRDARGGPAWAPASAICRSAGKACNSR